MEVPWEFLYDPNFLSVSVWTPVVRYLDLPTPKRRLRYRRRCGSWGWCRAPLITTLSVLDAEIPNESDRVAVEIGDGGELDAFVDRFYRSWGQPSLRDADDVLIQVVDRDVQ